MKSAPQRSRPGAKSPPIVLTRISILMIYALIAFPAGFSLTLTYFMLKTLIGP